MSFHEDSQIPERYQGYDETAVVTQPRMDDVQPSVQTTDRFGLEKQGKGYLTRKYNIEISKAGNPYFVPVESMLMQFISDAEAALAEARAQFRGSADLQTRADLLIPAAVAYFNARCDDAGTDREWLARSMVIWPMTDQVGYHLYKATSGEADLVDFGAYLARTDGNIKSADDLDSDERYQKRQFWTDLAYSELAVLDAVIQAIEPTEYNFAAIVAAGYRQAAQLDTKNHLRGVQGSEPITSDTDQDALKAQILRRRRAASAAA